MAIRYYKLFDMLNRRGMKKTDLYKILSSNTVAKLSKGEYVSGEVIEKICEFMHCQPGDIMEYIEIIKDDRTGKTIEHAEHTTWENDPMEPTPDYPFNEYQSDEDSPFEKGYKPRIGKDIPEKALEEIIAKKVSNKKDTRKS